MNSELKQVIIIISNLNMSKGKIAAQSAHASVEAAFSANKKLFSKWRSQGMKKIVLKVDSKDELEELIGKARDADIACSIITDAGHTEVKAGTITCGAIGPGPEGLIDKITGNLKTL